jgi:hypothetical protein
VPNIVEGEKRESEKSSACATVVPDADADVCPGAVGSYRDEARVAIRGEGCGMGLEARFRRGDSATLEKAGGLVWSEETFRARRGEWRTGSRSSSLIFFSGGICVLWEFVPAGAGSSVAGVPQSSAGRIRLCLLK